MKSSLHRLLVPLVLLLAADLFSAARGEAHPLGNFTINHYSGLKVDSGRIGVHYVVDMAEIPTVQALQLVDGNRDGVPSQGELQDYGRTLATTCASELRLSVDGMPVPLQVGNVRISLPAGQGGLPTLRLECDLSGALAAASTSPRRLTFQDTRDSARIGWREIVVQPGEGMAVFNSSAFGSGLTRELREYPAEATTLPLNERSAEFSFCLGDFPRSAAALRTRQGEALRPRQDLLAGLIAVPQLTPLVALLGLLAAFVMGGGHAFSPGHGKTVVGAYLVGSRGTPRHALFLGVTVTITHTAGVFALGLVTLFASHYILPERMFSILSFSSGILLAAVGANLLAQRVRAAVSAGQALDPGCEHDHLPGDEHDHSDLPIGIHSHGGAAHSHLPPGADGSEVTWKSLLGLGISGGLLPCPSALIVLLSAVALNRVGYGLLLVLAFSAGLASVLTAIGLMFVQAGRLMKHVTPPVWLTRWIPIGGALAVTLAGIMICARTATQEGARLFQWDQGTGQTTALAALSLLGSGLVFGIKHALEADHLAAVTAIVSERKSVWSSSLVGGLWGVGHTLSLLAAGVLVLLLHVRVGERTAMLLEFGVGLMLLGLGLNAVRVLGRGGELHSHLHRHGERVHQHPHLHDAVESLPESTHHGVRPGIRPLLVGMVHGMAGSAALMLLVLSTVPSPALGFAFIAVFGIGSIGGMMGMSALVGLPFHFTSGRYLRLNLLVRASAALFSVGIGLSMIYTIGIKDGLLRFN